MSNDHDPDAALRRQLEALARAPDRTTVRLDIHVAECDERQRNILASFSRLETGQAAVHARLDVVSNRMWAAAASGLALGVTAIAGLLILILTRGLK